MVDVVGTNVFQAAIPDNSSICSIMVLKFFHVPLKVFTIPKMMVVVGMLAKLAVLMVRFFNYLPMVKTSWLPLLRDFIIQKTAVEVGIGNDHHITLQ